MPRKATLKGLQSIIRQNIKKYLDKQKLTKKEYNEVIKIAEEYLSNATHEDLKQKGIVQKIINGGMKRPSDDDGNRPIERPLKKRIIDSFWGIPFNDEAATDEAYKKEILNVFEEEINTTKKYQRAMSNLEKAILEKEEAETHIKLVERKKKH